MARSDSDRFVMMLMVTGRGGKYALGARRIHRPSAGLAAGAMLANFAGCAIGPRNLAEDRLIYNDVVKVTAEQQLLLNIGCRGNSW